MKYGVLQNNSQQATSILYMGVSQKNPPLRFSDIFFQTDGNFLINFYAPITRSFLH